MRTNHAPGADSSITARSHGRRNRAADTLPRAVLFTVAPALAGGRDRQGGRPLRRYFGPLSLPRRVVGAVLFAVPAVLHGGLPELDAFEVAARRVGVVLRARALLQRFHERA